MPREAGLLLVVLTGAEEGRDLGLEHSGRRSRSGKPRALDLWSRTTYAHARWVRFGFEGPSDRYSGGKKITMFSRKAMSAL